MPDAHCSNALPAGPQESAPCGSASPLEKATRADGGDVDAGIRKKGETTMQVRPITRRSDYRSSARFTPSPQTTTTNGCGRGARAAIASSAIGASDARSMGAAATLMMFASAALAAALALLTSYGSADGRIKGYETTFHGVDKVSSALCVRGGADRTAAHVTDGGGGNAVVTPGAGR